MKSKKKLAEPRSFRKRADRDIRLSKTGTASDAIGKLELGRDMFILNYGQFSFIDAIAAMLYQTGPAEISLSTWCSQGRQLDQYAVVFESPLIRALRLVMDPQFERGQPQFCRKMRDRYGADCIRVISSHAKFAVIRSETHDLMIRTSMNLYGNQRLETLEIVWDRELAAAIDGAVDDIFSEPGMVIDAVAVEEVESLFALVDGTTIERSELNEPACSHGFALRD